MIPGHDCNAYCVGGEHCDLVYADTDDPGSIAQAYGWTEGVVVTRVAPAREAPPPDADVPSVAYRGLTPAGCLRIADRHRLLVFWRVAR